MNNKQEQLINMQITQALKRFSLHSVSSVASLDE